jgi:N-acetylmuramoyl-L-alanine amidase
LSVRPFSLFSRFVSSAVALGLIAAAVSRLAGQVAAPPLTLLSRDGRRPLSVSTIDRQEMVALDDLAAAFQLTVREEAGAITVSYRGRTIVLTPEQTLASVAGRLVSLPSRPIRSGTRWFVPLQFINRALALVYDSRIDLRPASRLVVVGDLRVPRVTIRPEAAGIGSRLVVDATPRTATTTSQEDSRLTIKFDADMIDVALPTPQQLGAGTIVQGIRTLDPVTIAVDLGPQFGAYRASSQALDAATRTVIDFVPAAADTAAAPPPATPPDPPADVLFGPPASAVRTIAIDPGHGGDDAGVRGAGGAIEKDLTLAVARRLRAAIEARLGIRVLLTRDDDRPVAIDNRPAMANNNKADIFISLHANASPRPAASGASVYVAAFSDADRARAAATGTRVPTFGGGLRDLELVLWDLAQTRFLDQSNELANRLQDRLDSRVVVDAQPVGQAPYRVLESANMPAVLIEMCYLSNPEDEKRLASAEFQAAFVQAVFEAIVGFRDWLAEAGGER